jgi:hypothetical protein
MTIQPSSTADFAPTQTVFAPSVTTPLPHLDEAPSGRLGPPSLGLIIVALGWVAMAAGMVVVGGMVFIGIFQAAAGG